MSIQTTAAEIMQLRPLEVIENPVVRQRFIEIYQSIWPDMDAEAAYERESIHFNRILRDTPNLQRCTPLSIFIAFIDLAVNGLSLEPGVRALCYLQPRSYKTGVDANGRDIWEARINLVVSGYGELVMRTRAGQIRHADNPVVVYEGDDFRFADKGGVKTVDYALNIGHNAAHPVACYMRITRADGSIDYAVMLESDWIRLAGFSAKQDRRTGRPNELYTSGVNQTIDVGFLCAKCIKHAFKTYPRLRVGKGTSFESDDNARQEPDFYGGIGGPVEQPAASQKEPDHFAQPADLSEGVTVTPSDDEDDTW